MKHAATQGGWIQSSEREWEIGILSGISPVWINDTWLEQVLGFMQNGVKTKNQLQRGVYT